MNFIEIFSVSEWRKKIIIIIIKFMEIPKESEKKSETKHFWLLDHLHSTFNSSTSLQHVDEKESHNFDLFSSASTSMKWKQKNAIEMLSHSERKHVGVNCENFHEVEIKHYIACLTYINRKQSEGEPQPKNKRLHFSAYQDRIVVKKINEAECRHVASKFPLRVKGTPTDSWLNLMFCELLPSFHRLETFLQFTSGFGLFTLQNKLRLNELVEAQSTQLPATVRRNCYWSF